MKQTLQLRLGQQLTMTPQLQQAIKLLQLSSLDLQQEIQQALDSNMMLEMAEDEGFSPPEVVHDLSEPKSSEPEPEYRELGNMDAPADIPQELAVDSSWDEVYDNLQSFTPASSGDSDNDDFLLQRAPAQTLQDLLVWQMELTNFSETDYAIATAIIDSIDTDGYLTAPIADIHQGLASQMPGLELDEVKAVLHRIQSFDPPGVAATDLADCLRIQLLQLPEDTPWRKQALSLVTHHLDILAKKDLNRLKRNLDIDDEDLNHIVALIRSLEPKPGRLINTGESQYIIPDVFVFRQGEQWIVTLNPDIAPKLRINPFYSNMIKRADSSSDNVTMKNHLQEARWFIKSLQSRNETLLKVARSIVERQKEFLDYGETAMKPLVLRDIAEEVGMHESTISRVTTQKYIHTPNGVFEFKYFFSSHVSTNAGGECSATAIKAFLREIVDQEDPAKPLSDDVISKKLKERGINVARRTIAKYREAMAIPPSNERKRVF
ncbi:RNA polymerase factor sigma-54 [Methylomagnum ishizawai]|uniref:RNA polymerase factor sigma-54 n=1 Tax=Methylomagnum ishizawai TaxID=1760988 RepID=UPI001C327A1A|nr:RNA polymerase factor sigma-54 [Methylomagnum ishizawai]BBL76035.1 RNA polymerase sigma-54 factor [Methylomagnum ishizawai]